MSSIDRVSINRPEPDNFLAEERRRQLARQHQLQARETSRLVLSSVETRSRIGSRKAQDDRRYESELEGESFAAKEEADLAHCLKQSLLEVGRSATEKSTGRDMEAPDSGFRHKPSAQNDMNKGVALHHDAKENGIRASLKKAEIKENARSSAAFARDQEPDIEHAKINADPGESQKLTEISWAQRVETAFAQSKETASPNAANAAAPLENLLEQLMQEVQTKAMQSESLAPELASALETLFKRQMSAINDNPNSTEMLRLQGSYRFLDAFLKSMENSSRSQTKAGKDATPVLLKPDELPERRPVVHGKEENLPGPHREAERKNVAPERDRQALYEFLELLSSAAASSAPIALQQLAQARQTNPEKALLRLAASGDQSVALFAPEIARRFDLLSKRLELDGKKSARTTMLANEVSTQKRWMDSVIEQADSLVGYRTLSRRSEDAEREKNLVETLPQLILNKS
jgi:hypothetical protein